MGDQFKQQEEDIQKLMVLKKKSIEVNDLHREVDKENAQENWSTKLKLFQDEASKQSWQAALDKAMKAVEDLIAKLRSLDQVRVQIIAIKEDLENKI